MATDMTLFKGNSLVNSDLFKSLMDMNKTLSGNAGGSGRRISIRGRRFRMMVDGEQIAVKKEDALNVVIVNAAGLTRTYYSAAFDPENPAPPDCWSLDTRVPAAEVSDEGRQASRCADCPMNVKGSGQGDSRACRYSQRVAVVLEGALDEVYQMQIPAASLFGDAQGNNMSLQAYTKFLNAHSTPVVAVITQLRFDDNADAPKLFFSPVRPLDEEELKTVLEARESEAAKKAIEFIVTPAEKKDDSGDIHIPMGKAPAKAAAKAKPRAAAVAEDEEDDEPAPAKAAAKAKPRAAAVAEDEEDDDPVVVDKKTKPVAGGNADKLASILQGWGDDE